MLKNFKFIIIMFVLTLIISSCHKPQYILPNDGIEEELDERESISQEEQIRPNRELSLLFSAKNTSYEACIYNDTIYYTGLGGWGILRYIDPQTGFSEILCTDALCTHKGPKALCLANVNFFDVWRIATDGKCLYVYAIKDKSIYDDFKGSYREPKHGIYEIDLKNNNIKTIIEWNSLDGRLIPTIMIQDDYIYYTKRNKAEDNYNTLYRVKKTGGNYEQLNKNNISFQQFEILGNEIYYRSLDNIIYKSDFSTEYPQVIAENAMNFIIKDRYIYTANEKWEYTEGNYAVGDSEVILSIKVDTKRVNKVQRLCE